MSIDGYALPDLAWSPWVPLKGAGRDARLPRLPGLYRIRSVETGRMLYIGQTGRSLRARLGQPGGVYGDVMPYNDPHTAGPALWVHRIETGAQALTLKVLVLQLIRLEFTLLSYVKAEELCTLRQLVTPQRAEEQRAALL